VESVGNPWDEKAWTQLLRRAQLIVQHHRYHGQPVDARQVVQRVLASHPSPARYRALLEEAVDSILCGFR
jgi:hypothetical protein